LRSSLTPLWTVCLSRRAALEERIVNKSEHVLKMMTHSCTLPNPRNVQCAHFYINLLERCSCVLNFAEKIIKKDIKLAHSD